MNSVFDFVRHVPKAVGTVLASAYPYHQQADVMPVLWALLLATLVLTVLLHWRHAIGSIAIPAGIPVLPGGVPVLGHAFPVLRNLHRCVRLRCGVYEAYNAWSYVHRLPSMLKQAFPRAIFAAVAAWWFVDRKHLGPCRSCKLLRSASTSWIFLHVHVHSLHHIGSSGQCLVWDPKGCPLPTLVCCPQLAFQIFGLWASFTAFNVRD